MSGARSLPGPVRPDPLVDTACLVDARGRLFDVRIGALDAADGLRKDAENSALLAPQIRATGLDIDVAAPLAHGMTRDEADEPVYVVISRHSEGIPLDFRDLTEEECESLGAAIARIHALDTRFLLEAGHTGYPGAQVRDQLAAWTRALAHNASVPDAITMRWQELLRIDALWRFEPVVAHGSLAPDDILYAADSTVTTLRRWQGLSLADPASDFAWLFDDGVQQWQRDEVLSGYGQMLGERMDPRIVPRARLWRQLTAVREFLEALSAGDHDRLAAARRGINAIASALSPVIAVGTGHPVTAVPGSGTGRTATKAERAEQPASQEQDRSGTQTLSTAAGQAISSEGGRQDGQDGQNETDVSDDTREASTVAAQDDISSSPAPSGGSVSGSHPLSRLSQLDDATVEPADSLSFTGTGRVETAPDDDRSQTDDSESRTGNDRTGAQSESSARFATNTNMPAIQPDGTRTSLAAVADTRSAQKSEQAQTLPFQTQAYIDTDAPDGTVRVTHSTSVRERLFPDDPGEELFHGGKDGADDGINKSDDAGDSDESSRDDGRTGQ
jgi:aminoglycoside phosphotransferase (APT) family kinase protein